MTLLTLRLSQRGLLCLSALLGPLGALGHDPFGYWGLSVIAFAGFFVLYQFADTPRQVFLTAWLFGSGYFCASLNWLINPFYVDADTYAWMAPFALGLMGASLALFWAVMLWLGTRIFTHSAAKIGIFVIALTLGEWLRSWLFTGFPWATPGTVWINTPVAQLAALIGLNGLTFLTFASSATLGYVTCHHVRKDKLIYGISLHVIIICITAMVSTSAPPDDQNITLRLVQPNAPQHLKWHPDYTDGFFQRQLALTSAPAKNAHQPDLIIWPETATPYRLDQALFDEIARAANGSFVAFGAQRIDEPRFFNSLAVVSPEASLIATYDKTHLVPFGEYIPFGDFLAQIGIRGFAPSLGEGYSKGEHAQILNLGPLGNVLPLICYEAIFSRHVKNAPKRPDWLLNVTNDAWFGHFSGPQQHLSLTRFRAIEFGLPIARVANTGISAIIDSKGKIRAELPLNKTGFLDHPLPGASSPTLYARFGDWGLMILIAGWLLVTRKTFSHLSKPNKS